MIPHLEYVNENWDICLPVIDAYAYSTRTIDEFVQGDRHTPLAVDVNINSPCNTNCIYCSTNGGKRDLRYLQAKGDILTDEKLREFGRQIADAGVKTFFICSNGEPLLNVDRFLSVATPAVEKGVKVITYTNGTTITKDTARQLHDYGINLVLKLESLSPVVNDAIVLNEGSQRRQFSYKYATFQGQQVPEHIPIAFEEYGCDAHMLGIESMISKQNFDSILALREWCFSRLNVAHFLKQLYPLGYVQIRKHDVLPLTYETIDKDIERLDNTFGIRYPSNKLPDSYSYDIRRLINNLTTSKGFPARMFFHEQAGTYLSSQSVAVKFGFESNTVQLLAEGKLDFASATRKVRDCL